MDVDARQERNVVVEIALAAPRRAGRRPKEDTRADELRERLVKWSYFPPKERPSLRKLAEALNTNHQLLSHLLVGLEEWERRGDAARCRVLHKRQGRTPAEAVEKKWHLLMRKSRRDQALEWVKHRPAHEAWSRKCGQLYLAKFGPVICEKLGLLKPEDPMAMWTKPPEGLDTWRMLWSD
jgi:hypothetical protein